MACTVNSQQCDYLRSPTTSYVFASERAEFAHVNEQISSLDNHISQLNTLRSTLHRRSRQLHNIISPVQALPVEVLSSIFKQIIDSAGESNLLYWYRGCLRKAFALSSVTTHFRYVAFSTPELWKKIPLVLRGTGPETTKKALGLLQHCIALASNVDILISDEKKHVRSAMNALLKSDAMRKVKAFRLSSVHWPKLWIEKLKVSSLPIFDTLTLNLVRWKDGGLDLGTFNTITRLAIQGPAAQDVSPFIIPSSVQHLQFTEVPERLVVSLIYQCPNLVECTVTIEHAYLVDGTKFIRPLTLNHLKRLTITKLGTGFSTQNLQLPSLEFLDIKLSSKDTSLGVILLCRNVSATLTTLIINFNPNILNYDDLCQLCRLPFPKLRELEFVMFPSSHQSSILDVIRALTPQDNESNDSGFQMLPSLRSLRLYCWYSRPCAEPYSILDMLKKWRVGETSYFHLNVSYPSDTGHTWSPELREELRTVLIINEHAVGRVPFRSESGSEPNLPALIMLRDPLPHRLRQLHNPLSPIHTLPIEVLSYIFEQLVNLGRWDSRGISWDQQCLARAWVVSSVSSHFRRVAFDTPELWKRIPLFLTNEATIGKASALLQHCIALAPYVNISVSDSLDKKEARSAIDVLLIPDATQKTKAFELFYSSRAPTVWMEKLKGSSFPMLDTLEIKHNTMGPNFDLGTLKTLTRLHISNQCLDRPIIVPESLQYLDIRYITRQAFTSLLYLCPNLVECIAFVDRQHSNHLDGDAQFTEPVTLRHLKQLTSDIVDVGETSSLTQNLQLPSLEILRLRHFQGSKFTTAIQLCRNVSATLTTLIINKTSGILVTMICINYAGYHSPNSEH